MDDNLNSQSVKVQDEDRLAELGYKQELKRNWSMLHNFGVSFSIIVSLKYLYYLQPRLVLEEVAT